MTVPELVISPDDLALADTRKCRPSPAEPFFPVHIPIIPFKQLRYDVGALTMYRGKSRVEGESH